MKLNVNTMPAPLSKSSQLRASVAWSEPTGERSVGASVRACGDIHYVSGVFARTARLAQAAAAVSGPVGAKRPLQGEGFDATAIHPSGFVRPPEG